MSVEPRLLRIRADELGQLRESPEDFVEERYEPDAFVAPRSFVSTSKRMLQLDEFSMWLLTGFDDDTPVARAVSGWDARHLADVTYGHGSVYVRDASDVATLWEELKRFPVRRLHQRYASQADLYRVAAAGYFDDDKTVLRYQAHCFDALMRWYGVAVREGEGVVYLLM